LKVGEETKLSGEAEWKMEGGVTKEEEEEETMKEAGRRPIRALAPAIPTSIPPPPPPPPAVLENSVMRGGRYRPLGLRLAESRSEEEGEGKKGEEMRSLLWWWWWCRWEEEEGEEEEEGPRSGGECPLR
jgi:hypothetical protein